MDFKYVFIFAITVLTFPDHASAQVSDISASETKIVDEVIAYGRKGQSGNRAMRAFNAGDYATAEIEFEKHFRSLRRSERAVKRAVRLSADASISQLILDGPGEVSLAGIQTNPNAPLPATLNPASLNASSQNNLQAVTSLNADGKITYEDFGFSLYMSGLSQIQLGKFAKAKESFSESLEFNHRNYDARMRLGLLELRDGNFEIAAIHLKALDKQRKKCRDGCQDSAPLTEATLTLANALSAR